MCSALLSYLTQPLFLNHRSVLTRRLWDVPLFPVAPHSSRCRRATYTFYFICSVTTDLWSLPLSFQAPRAPDCSPYRSRTLVTRNTLSVTLYWSPTRNCLGTRHQHTEPVAWREVQAGYSGTASRTGTLVLPAPLSQLPISFVHANDVILKVGKSSFSLLRCFWMGG